MLAASLTAALILGACWNLRRIDTLNSDMQRCLDLSEQALGRGDEDRAEAALKESLSLWLEAESYTHIFIRHAEIDGATDAFYEAQEQLADGNGPEALAAMDKLRYHLDSLCRMEHLSLGSIM